MHTHIAFFFIKWGLVRNKGALPFCSLWSKPAKDESFIFSRSQTILQSFYIFMPFTMPVVQKVLHCIRRLPEKTGQFCIVI